MKSTQYSHYSRYSAGYLLHKHHSLLLQKNIVRVFSTTCLSSSADAHVRRAVARLYLAVAVVSISAHEVDAVAVLVPEGSLI